MESSLLILWRAWVSMKILSLNFYLVLLFNHSFLLLLSIFWIYYFSPFFPLPSLFRFLSFSFSSLSSPLSSSFLLPSLLFPSFVRKTTYPLVGVFDRDADGLVDFKELLVTLRYSLLLLLSFYWGLVAAFLFRLPLFHCFYNFFGIVLEHMALQRIKLSVCSFSPLSFFHFYWSSF